MDDHPNPGDDLPARRAAMELASLHQQAEQARLLLKQLQRDVALAEKLFRNSDGAQLLEANEQLVIAALNAQAHVDTATQALQEVSRSAELDPLTELPNRVLLLDRFAQAISHARRHGAKMALLFLDLNNFKQINDTLGHAVGDQALKVAARSMMSSVRASDTVSRHGGDEFVILLAEISQPSDAARIADKLIAALRTPKLAGGNELRLTASIGISIYPDHGEDADMLIERADQAMYRAKKMGRGSYSFFDTQPMDSPPPTLVGIHHELTLAEHQCRNAQLREANQQLLLAALSAQQLQAAAEAAQQRQTDFLALLAHELRNPLAPIRSAAALLTRSANNAPLLRQVQLVIERQIVHMSRLVGDLTDVSRVNTGKLRIEWGEVDMNNVITAAVDACRPAIDTRAQHLDVQPPPHPTIIHGDTSRLIQVLSNLIDNASKYTRNGGSIALSATLVDEALQIIVSDDGIGISPDSLSSIFDPFMQDTHAIGFNGVGLGIGLTVVKELVLAHGGTIVAYSAGRSLGSTFTVTLPLQGHEPMSTEAQADAQV